MSRKTDVSSSLYVVISELGVVGTLLGDDDLYCVGCCY